MNLFTFILLSIFSCCLSIRVEKDWWKNSDIYDISIWTFKDSDGDGIGDLNGVASKLDYIEELGIATIKLSPVFSSIGIIDTKYGINDFKNIHITLGTMEDFENLVATANAKGMKVILDFLINHCSTSHEWFEKSRRRIDPYTDYFLWRDRVESDSYSYDNHWKWDRIRKQFYYHFYNENNLADLNLKNPTVKEEVKELIKFWLDKGVSGLNLLSAHKYIKDLEDEMVTKESYEFVHELREFMDTYSEENGGYERVILLDNHDVEGFSDLHGNETYPIAQIVSVYPLKDTENSYGMTSMEPSLIYDRVVDVLLKKNNGQLLLVSEDDTTKRMTNVFYHNKQFIDVWLTIAFTLPSLVHIFSGQEIGVLETHSYTFEDQRPFSSAIAWDSSLLGGFTDADFSLLTPSIDSYEKNVETMMNEERSRLNLVKDLLKVRKSDAIRNGDFENLFMSDWIYAYKRSFKNKESFIVLMNTSNKDKMFDLNELWKNQVPATVQVVASTPSSAYRKGATIETKLHARLAPSSSMVLKI